MTRGNSTKYCFILLCALVMVVSLRPPALAEPDEDQQTLEMFYEGKDLVVSATRSPKPLSQSAENITVITAADIERMGAHTLGEVLNTVPGIVNDDRGSVGNFGTITIQGALPPHILFLLDGVTLNFLDSGFPNAATIPVQDIERIEIVKGPGSSSWGSALGGVVNIVTKSPLEGKKLGGTLSFSAGERDTRDSRGEGTGTLGRLGYYLFAGNLTSSGLRPSTGVDENNLYGKFRWELPGKGDLTFTIGYTKEHRGDGADIADDLSIRSTFEHFFTTLSLNYSLNASTELDLSLRESTKHNRNQLSTLSTGELLQDSSSSETSYGGSAKLSWRKGFQNLVVGGDFDHLENNSDANLFFQSFFSHIALQSDKFGIFCNDTFTYKGLSITPGIRYDRMNPVGDFVSPSLGIAWSLNDRTILRGYVAHGYSLPLMTPDQPQEKVLTYQAGVETTQIPYLWLKTTFFRNELSDVQSFDFTTGLINLVKQLKQGVEVEGKTVSFLNTALSAGYTFVDASNRDTGETLAGVPRQIVKLGLLYDDQRSLKGALLGRYVWWNADVTDDARDNAFIWDLGLSKRVMNVNDLALELFFNAHNLFNGAQYSLGMFPNARRWVEGGIRFKF
jgi:vitamin B12 transporter